MGGVNGFRHIPGPLADRIVLQGDKTKLKDKTFLR
jgi:hypothetical protein